MAEVVSTGVSHMCDNSTVSVNMNHRDNAYDWLCSNSYCHSYCHTHCAPAPSQLAHAL